MIKSIRILILAAFIAFLANGFLENHLPQEDHMLDSFFTLLLLAVIWFNLRHHSQGDERRSDTKEASPQVSPRPFPHASPATEQNPQKKTTLPPTIGGLSVIYHQPPWCIVERGDILGTLNNARISSWIRTSDKRLADYSGVQSLSYLEQCACIEIPERSELIVFPGMVYTIRPS